MVHLCDLIQLYFMLWLRHVGVLQFLYTVDDITLSMRTPQHGRVQKAGIQISPS